MGNPAAVALLPGEVARGGVAALRTPTEQGVMAALLTAAVALPRGLTVGISVARVTVDGLVRTETDPQTIGGEIPYGTTVISATVARLNARRLAVGLALRYRRGELDAERAGAIGVDAGVLAEHLPFRDASVGAATFLWRPGNPDVEGTTLNVAADLRVLGPDTLHEVRAGYSLSSAGRRYGEHFGFATARYGIWEGRAGLARVDAYGPQPWRARMGIVLHYAPYDVGIAREENGAGLSANYQFTLKATIR